MPDLDSVRADWTRLAAQMGNIFGTWEWADAWWRNIGVDAELCLAVARRSSGEAVAILPLSATRRGPVRLVRFVGAGPSDELGPVCAPADRRAALAVLKQHIVQTLRGSGVFLGERLSTEPGTASDLGGIVIGRAASPVLPIAARSFDDFLASRSRNFRSQVRGRERNLALAHKLTYRLTRDPDRLEADMGMLMRLHTARFPDDESNAFRGRRAPFHLDFAKRALDNGWLRLWTMELDGAPVAMWYGLRYAGIESYYQAGRDPAFNKLNVGFVLLCHSVRCAFEDGLSEYRFGLGDESYKNRFAESDPGLETVGVPAGIFGRMAFVGLRAALRMPEGARRRVSWLADGRDA